MSMMVFMVGFTMAQRAVSGTIVDSDGLALIGANVSVPNTTIGTITDVDGNFSINVPDGASSVIVTYIGFTEQLIDITGQSSVNVVMSEGALIDEVVITSTGLERNARDITYSNQSVDSEELLSAPNKNTLEALRGKVAGVKISTGSGSVGASTRIVLRGESSLTGDNNALIVIDGIPIDNAASRGGDGSASTGYTDYGNRFSDLNPDDIESVTVLKGPSATSLYGSRGASGALVITTKKGKKSKDGGMQIGYNGSYSVEKAYVLLQRQDQYGQGFGLPFANIPGRDSGENWSWGPAFDGVVRPWTSPVDVNGDGSSEYLSRPYSAVENQLDDFFRLGNTMSNSFYLSGANDNFNYRASYSNTNQNGILDNTNYLRNTIGFSAGAKLTDKLTTNFNITYANIDQNSAQEGSRPFEGQNAYANAVQSPVNIPFAELRDYKSKYHDFDGYYGSYTVNPYYVLNEYGNNAKINNILGSVSTTYQVSDKLAITGRIGSNIVTTQVNETVPIYAYNDHLIWNDNQVLSSRGGRHSSDGYYFTSDRTNRNIDATLLANYSTDITEDIDLNLTVGYNDFRRNTRSLASNSVGGLVVNDFYQLNNSVQTPQSSLARSDYRIFGTYGQASFGWKNKVFLDLSARNDWSSTLPRESQDFFYSSIGVSAVMSDILKLEDTSLDFWKVFTSIGTTGKDAGLYQLASTFSANPTIQALSNGHDITSPLNGQAAFTLGNRIGNPDLKPELTTTFELGTEVTLLQDMVNLSYTYYNSNSTDQIVVVSLPSTSGFTSTTKNVGEVNNRGHELTLNLQPLAKISRDLKWSLDLIYSKNTNKVIKISDESDELSVGGFGNVTIVAKEGLPFGTFKGSVVRTTEAGQTVVGANGLPLYTTDEEYIGSYQPDWTGSIGSNLSYKGLGFNVLFDIKRGGQFLSYTKDLTEFNGTSVTTLIGDRGEFVVDNSVQETFDGTGASTGFAPNTVATNPYDYVSGFQFSEHLIDASFVKLRELGVSYQLPKNLLSKFNVADATIRLFGKNLKFWLPEENTFADPEVNGPSLTGNATGIETTQTPPSKSYGVSLSLKF